jgi:hypothetical protein
MALCFTLLALQGAAQVKPWYAEVKLEPRTDSGAVRAEVIFHLEVPAAGWLFWQVPQGVRMLSVEVGSRQGWRPITTSVIKGKSGWDGRSMAGDTLQLRMRALVPAEYAADKVRIGASGVGSLPVLEGYWGFPASRWLVQVPRDMELETLMERDFEVTRAGQRWVGLRQYTNRPAEESWVRWTGWKAPAAELPVAAVPTVAKTPADEWPKSKTATLPVAIAGAELAGKQEVPALPSNELEPEDQALVNTKQAAQLPNALPPAQVGVVGGKATAAVPMSDEERRFRATWGRWEAVLPLPVAAVGWDRYTKMKQPGDYTLGTLTYGDRDAEFMAELIRVVSPQPDSFQALWTRHPDSLLRFPLQTLEEQLAVAYNLLAEVQVAPPRARSRWIAALLWLRRVQEPEWIDQQLGVALEQGFEEGFSADNALNTHLMGWPHSGLSAAALVVDAWPAVALDYRYSAQDKAWVITQTQYTQRLKGEVFNITYGNGLKVVDTTWQVGAAPLVIPAEGPRFWFFPDPEQRTPWRFDGVVPGAWLVDQAREGQRFTVRYAALVQLMRDRSPGKRALAIGIGLKDPSVQLRRKSVAAAALLPPDQFKKVLPTLQAMARGEQDARLKRQVEELLQARASTN